MNKERRKRIQEICDALETHKETIEEITNDEQDAYDALPVGIQNSEKGEKMEEALDYLEYAIEKLNEAISQLDFAKK